jgi:hypothetical protein
VVNGHNTKLRRLFAAILFLLEVISDVLYASSTQTIVNGDITRIFTTGSGGFLGTVLYAICVGFGSTFVLINGCRLLGNVITKQPS